MSYGSFIQRVTVETLQYFQHQLLNSLIEDLKSQGTDVLEESFRVPV